MRGTLSGRDYIKANNEREDTLPPHWRKVQLGDPELFSFENGIWTGKKSPFVDCPILRNTNFTEYGALDMSDIAVLPIEQRQLDRKKLVWGDIIIERSGGGPQQPVGRVAFFDQRDGNYCFSNFTTRLRINDQTVILPEYLHLFLLHFYFSGYTEKMQNRTTGIRNLAFEDYKKSAIYFPPVPEQRAIAHILQTVQNAIQARRNELELERERKAALMQHLFTRGTRGEATKQTEIGEMPESWEVVQLEELLREPLKNGYSAKESDTNEGVRTLTLTAVTQNKFSVENTKLTVADPGKVQDLWLKPGDIFIERANTFEFVGLTALYDGTENFAIYPDLLIRVRLKEDIAHPRFIAEFLLTTVCRSYFRRNARGTAGNMPKIDHGIVRRTPVPLPALTEQQQIAAILQACDSKITALEKEIALQEELFRALLEELMSGRLSALPLVEAEGGAREA
jgi:type I restriction enzyme S subunit